MTKFVNDQITTEWQTVRRKAVHSLHTNLCLLSTWLQGQWFRLAFLALLVFLLVRKDLTLQLNLKSNWPSSTGQPYVQNTTDPLPFPIDGPMPEVTTSTARREAYVQRHADLARREMAASGIPASIKLGQALLETNAGESELATRFHNHFGIKCFRKDCRKGHCSNFSDDSHKDFFRIYPSVRESYHSHSQLLQGDRYRHLFDLPPTDYKAWAQGLQRAGYATDKQYAYKLIKLIENLKLYRFDN